jgi:hypothetical protein
MEPDRNVDSQGANVSEYEAETEAKDADERSEHRTTVVSSFRDERYESEEMINFISFQKPEDKLPFSLEDVTYKPATIFPEWIIANNEWKTTKGAMTRDIAEIVRTTYAQRTQEQTTTLINFVMSAWEPGKLLGPRRCEVILKEFLHKVYEPEETIVSEGEGGLTLYIIISGMINDKCLKHLFLH